jgi:hypothetical protein
MQLTTLLVTSMPYALSAALESDTDFVLQEQTAVLYLFPVTHHPLLIKDHKASPLDWQSMGGFEKVRYR